MAISVEGVIGLRALRKGLPKVLAGARNLDNPVRWLHTGDVGNISYYMRGGEVLLTAGATLGATPEDRRLFVNALFENGVVGLIIELRTAWSQVPTDVVHECETLGLPLISLEHQVAFVDVTQEVNSAIVNEEVSYLTQRHELAEQYNNAMLAGESVKHLLERLANQTLNPVLLVESSDAIVHCATRFESEEELMQIWSERQSDGHTDYIVRHLPSAKSTWSDWRLVVLPVHSKLDEHDQMAVEQAALAVALTLNKQAALGALPAKEPQGFILQLLSEEISDVSAALQATNRGFDAQFFVPLALSMPAASRSGETSLGGDKWEVIVRRIRTEFGRRNMSLLLATRETGLSYGVVGIPDPDGRIAAGEFFMQTSRRAAESTLALPVKVIIGQEVRSWRTLGRGLREVASIVPFVRESFEGELYDSTAPDVRRLLWSLRQNEAVQDFVAARLGPVLLHDAQKPSKLLPTLIAYCEHGGRKAEAARVLHIERPSLYDRLTRLEKLLDVSLRDPDALLGVHVAVLAYLGSEPEAAQDSEE